MFTGTVSAEQVRYGIMRRTCTGHTDIDYSIFNPTGNITILVMTPVPVSDQPAVASRLMELVPEAEQVGFVSGAEQEGFDIALRMAGGEFCGNATMCAAVFAAMQAGLSSMDAVLKVSGASEPVRALVKRRGDGSWTGTVEMPKPVKLEERELSGAGSVPVVFFDGISHVILEETIGREQAEQYAKVWCGCLGADAIGLMFLDRAASGLTPLVYVPGADTLCWENSCASGTTAVGTYLASKAGKPLSVNLRQPGGSLAVTIDQDGRAFLTGVVRQEA